MKAKLLRKLRKRANAQFKVDGNDVLRATNGTKHEAPYTVMYSCMSEEQAEFICNMEKRIFITNKIKTI